MTVKEILDSLPTATDWKEQEAFIALGVREGENGKSWVVRQYRGTVYALCGLVAGEAEALKTVIGRHTLCSIPGTHEYESVLESKHGDTAAAPDA